MHAAGVARLNAQTARLRAAEPPAWPEAWPESLPPAAAAAEAEAAEAQASAAARDLQHELARLRRQQQAARPPHSPAEP